MSSTGRLRCASFRCEPQPAAMREDGEHGRAEEPVADRPAHGLLGPLAGELDQAVVAHPGGARGHAGHAAQALVEVGDHLRREDGVGLVADPHQDDPAPG